MTPPKVIRIALATLVGGLAVAGFAAAAGAFSSGAAVRPPAPEGAASAAAPGQAAPAATLDAPSVAALRAAGVDKVVRFEREHGEIEVEGLDPEGRPVKARIRSVAGAPPTVTRDKEDDRDGRRGSKREHDDD